MSKEYIEKEALLAQVRESRVNNTHLDSRDRHAHDTEHRHFEYMIFTAKPANVASVLMGEWVHVRFSADGNSSADCNQCGATVYTGFASSVNFCPNCGAAMTEEAMKILARRGGERRE